MSKKIWKLQRPLYTNMPVLEVLAYTEDRKSEAFIPMTDYEIEELFGDNLKLYVKAKVNRKTGMLEVDKILEEQAW
jgi:hypothetical protein